MEVPRHWRLQKQRLSLTGDLCEVCGKPTFPPRDICTECTTKDLLQKRSGLIYQSDKITPQTPKPNEIVQD